MTSRDQQSRRVVVTTASFADQAVELLKQHGFEVTLATGSPDRSLSSDDLATLLVDADAWIVGHANVTAELLGRLPSLKVISRSGVGYEKIDIAAANEAGVVVTIAAGGNSVAVADHTVALTLAVLRRLKESQRNMESGNWTILQSNNLSGKTVGIIGLGRIGKDVVQRFRGFDCEVLVQTRSPDQAYAAKSGCRFVDLDTLLRASDVVSVHAPLNKETEFLINAAAFERMKPTAFLINVGRGGIVDDKALLHALKTRQIAGAGLDVFASESLPGFAEATAELISLPNVVATPHSAASSVESLLKTNMLAANAVIAHLRGERIAREQVVAGCGL